MNRGRPREFDEQQALHAALDVFWLKGYEGTTCGDLLAAMGINSGSMYAAFGDKQAIYDRALDLYIQKMVGPVMQLLEGSKTPLENIKATINCWKEFMSAPECNGCFVDNTLIEFGTEKKGAAELARHAVKRLLKAMEKQLRAAQELGELSEEVNPHEMALFLVNMKQGLSLMARSGAKKAEITAVVKTALSILS